MKKLDKIISWTNKKNEWNWTKWKVGQIKKNEWNWTKKSWTKLKVGQNKKKRLEILPV